MKRVFAIIICIILVIGSVSAVSETQKWKCPKCGNSASGKFCSKCGTKKPAKAEIVTPTPESTATLETTGTPEPTVTPKPIDAPEPTPTSKPTTKLTDAQKSTQAPTEVPIEKPTEETNHTPTEEKPNWLSSYGYDSSEVLIVSADILYEYGKSYVGKTIVTSIIVEDKATRSLKANTDNNDTYSFSVVAEFSDKNEISTVKEGDTVIVLGVVEEMNTISLFGADKTVTLSKSHLITSGITSAEIEATREIQLQKAKDRAAASEQKAIEAANQQKQKYIDSCEIVNYSDVERTPKKYKGKHIQITGTVIQVQEGWFGTVTLRVEQKDGNIWYVTYKRIDDDEPRILENDRLTFYGECTGVETYTRVCSH